jgi:hypothetical protein
MAKPKNNQKKSKRGGYRANAGRPKGVPNKITTDIKQLILAAMQAAHADGDLAYLTQQAKDIPTSFLTLLGKIIPAEVKMESKNEHTFNTTAAMKAAALQELKRIANKL